MLASRSIYREGLEDTVFEDFFFMKAFDADGPRRRDVSDKASARVATKNDRDVIAGFHDAIYPARNRPNRYANAGQSHADVAKSVDAADFNWSARGEIHGVEPLKVGER